MTKRPHITGVMVKSVPVVLLLVALLSSAVSAAPATQEIKMDYFGYRPDDTKVAIFTADPGSTVEVRDASDSVVYTIPNDGGSITSMGFDDQPSGDEVWQVDFTPFSTPGSYRLYVPSWDQQSYDFCLAEDVYNEVSKAAFRSYYYQRCGCAHPEPYADAAWSDPYVCHAYLTAVTPAPGEPDYGTLDLSGGWHDAGDYNKYMWGDSGVGALLRAYEENPDVFYDGQFNIPESGNGVPDILDEIKYEIDWMLKMQMPDGEVLYKVHDEEGGASDTCPPSNAVHSHHYYGPTVISGCAFTGSVAMFARICEEAGDPYGNVATLKQAATHCWNDYLLGQGDEDLKCWAAAQLWRMDQSITSARSYVEGYFSNWAEAFHEAYQPYTKAAIAYIQTPGADPGVVSDMKIGIGIVVDEYFDYRDLYRNAMKSWYYHWGSSQCRGAWGHLLTEAVDLGATGSHTDAECLELAEDFLHAFHGQNPMNMTYLSNMAAYNGEHSSFQFFHSWFGSVKDPESKAWYIGLPPGVTEPDFPYFKGTDNYGVSDDNYSNYGPAPGFVVGGPNKDYSGLAVPPKGETYYERFYRDWVDDSPRGWFRTKVWEINENCVGYQGYYCALVAAFMSAQDTPPAAPTGLTATAIYPCHIDLAWGDNAEPDLACYDIYRNSTKIASGVTVSAYSDTGVSGSTQYCYQVTAVDAGGNESAESDQACVTTPPGDSTPPAEPTGLAAAAGGACLVHLNWDDNTESDLHSYNVYRSTTSGGPYDLVGSPTDSAFLDASVDEGTAYYYVVTARDTSGNESGASGEASVTTPLLGDGLNGDYFDDSSLTDPPTLTRVDATVNFDWGDGSPDPLLPADGFSVRWTGCVWAPYSETYTFYTSTDDGVRLWVNDQLLIDHWESQAETEWSGTIALAPGAYSIKMEYFESSGGAIARLKWSSASLGKEVIPQDQLYSGSGGQNFPPTAADDSYSTPMDNTLNVAAPGVLGNDSDGNGDPLVAVKVSDPSHGSVTLNSDGSFSYTPDAGYTGVDSFTYKANDGEADSNVATVTISVTGAATMHVDSITVEWVAVGGPNRKGQATVVIKGGDGAAVEDATVSGTFSGTLSESGSGTTDSTGTAVITTSAKTQSPGSLTFCVDDVTHASLTYNSGDNVETCDSY